MNNDDFTPFTKEQLEANWTLVEQQWREAFKNVPSCPNCDLTQGGH